MEEFNLLIATSRGNERAAAMEIVALLREVGDPAARADRIFIVGLVVAQTVLGPFDAVQKLRSLLKAKPELFRYILKITPLDKVVPTDIESIKSTCREMTTHIGKDETFRITVNKRHSQLSSSEIIEVAATSIDRRVKLENPDKIVLIEILGHIAGISVIRPRDVISVVKERFSD